MPPLFIVDAFTDRPFAGNPAAVCLLDAPADEAWMQRVAAEMNLSETAFLNTLPQGYGLRWFTPEVEVALCGHATLASAHVLWEIGRARNDETLRFETRSGTLAATRQESCIELDFPSRPPRDSTPPPHLLEALGVEPLFVGTAGDDLFVVLNSESQLRAVTPDFPRLRQVATRGIIVTAPAQTAGFDFVSRFFAPVVGVPEDPVTGSAHCALAPDWSEQFGRSELIGFQASRRGGIVHVRCEGDRVILGGTAVTTVRGELLA